MVSNVKKNLVEAHFDTIPCFSSYGRSMWSSRMGVSSLPTTPTQDPADHITVAQRQLHPPFRIAKINKIFDVKNNDLHNSPFNKAWPKKHYHNENRAKNCTDPTSQNSTIFFLDLFHEYVHFGQTCHCERDYFHCGQTHILCSAV